MAPDPVAFRKGAPQTRHPHALLAKGEEILNGMFPGLSQELHTGGAIAANFGSELGFYISGNWCQPYVSAITTTLCSRPLLESTIYHTSEWKALYIMAMAPHTPRGAIIVPMEGDRWHLSLVGVGGDYPPTDEAGFMDFVRSLPSPLFYEALKDAEPLTAPYGYRRAENQMRYYEKLPRYIEGFVATGDAVYAFNPIYGQGMSTAAIASQMLNSCLKEQRIYGEKTLDGLAQRFQRELASVTAAPWAMATGQDIRWPTTEGGAKPDPVTRLVQGYLDKVLAVAPHNPAVAEAFFHVQNMLKGPESLFHPKVLWQVLKPQPSQPAFQPAPVRGLGQAVTA